MLSLAVTGRVALPVIVVNAICFDDAVVKRVVPVCAEQSLLEPPTSVSRPGAMTDSATEA